MKFLSKSRINQIVMTTLVAVMLVSAIGIAQVSHLCKMATAGIETTDCSDMENNSHPCCETVPLNPNESPCCNDIVKFHQGKITVVLKESLQLDKICFTEGFSVEFVNFFEENTPLSFDRFQNDILTGTGKEIIIFNNTFLI